MDTIKVASQLLERESFSELLPYLAYDDDHKIYVLDDGVGFVMECSPLAQAGGDTVAALRGIFEASGNPPGMSIQIMMLSSTRVKNTFNQYVLMREVKNGENLYTQFAKKTRDYYINGTKETILKGFQHRIRDFKLYVSVKLPVDLRTPEEYKNTRLKCIEIKNTFLQSLKTAYLFPRVMHEAEFVQLMKELINPNHEIDVAPKCDPSIPLKDQMVFSDNNIQVTKDYMIIDGKYGKSFTVNQFPEDWDISVGASFIGDLYENLKQVPAEFLISLNCIIQDQVQAEKKVKKLAMTVQYQAFGQIAKYLPDILKKKQHFDILLGALSNKEQIIKAFLHIYLYADNLEHLQGLTGSLKSLYRNMGIVLQEDTYINLPLFLQSMPMGLLKQSVNDLKRYKTMTTRVAAELAPVQADWKGTGTPSLLLFSRRGQVMSMDFFDNKTGNKNAIVIGPSGVGKSFFVNEIIKAYAGQNARIWITDAGRSYFKLAQQFGGQFISFEPNSKVCLNPFTKIGSYKELQEEHMSVLKSLIAQMASPSAPLSDVALAYIEEAIGESFTKYGSDTTITNISEHMKLGNDARANDVAKMLFPYTKKGSYANYFEGRSSLNPDSDLVVLELDDLKQKKDLQEVVLLSLIHQIQQEMYVTRNENIRKIVITDEAFEILQGGGSSANFLENAYRRYRKVNGCAIVVSQSLVDFERVSSGRAIIENSAFKFFLRQEQSSIEAIKSSPVLGLPDHYYDQLLSLNTDPGNYSEIFMDTPLGAGIGRLIVDRYTQLLYSTDPEEKVKIQKHMDKGLDLAGAITAIVDYELTLKMSA